MLKQRLDLQVLRGISVIFVFFFHLKMPFFSNGFLGVDIFFILSGFLMAHLYSEHGVLEFYKRRLRRILPAYFVTIAITTLVVALIAVPADADQRFDRFWFDIMGASNIAFWNVEGYFGPRYFKPLLNLWSLSIELQFYLIVPFLFPLLKNRIFLLVLLIIISLFMSILIFLINEKTSFFMMPLRIWEFLLGTLVAWYPINSKIKYNQKFVIISLLIIFFLIIFFYPLNMGYENNYIYGHPGLAVFLTVLITALIIYFSMDSILNQNNFVIKILSCVGDYSYSIYLVHFPVIVLINYSIFGGTKIGYNSLNHLLLVLLITSLFSYLMFNYVEKIRFSNKAILKILIIFLLTVLIGLIAPYINKLRYTEEQFKIFSAWKDRDVYRCGKFFRIINFKNKFCNIGINKSKDKLLLLGDSTADSIKKSFANQMNKHNISTYFYIYNNPLMDTKRSAKKILKDIENEKIKSVVFLMHKDFYREKKYTKELSILINDLKDLNIQFKIISPLPEMGFHVPKKLYQKNKDPKILFSTSNIKKYKKDNINFFKVVNNNPIKDEDIYLTYPIFCNQLECQIEKNGRPFYFDSDHLTLTGAKELEILFNKIAKNYRYD
jgi:peptidoglycan/LPS O-acetylase OafA/YrhL